MAILQTIGNSLTRFHNNRSYWKILLTSGKWISETDVSFDLSRGGVRERDWALDIVSTGDNKRIKELWLICPPSPTSPMGNTARLPIIHPGTAFQLKVKRVDGFGANGSEIMAQIIGRVEDLSSGLCTAFVWDTQLQAMMEPFHTHINKFEAWRPGIIPLGPLSKEVLGLSD